MGALLACGASYQEARMRVIDCNECGATIKAANDEDLVGEVDSHMQSEHSDSDWDSSQIVERQAYDAEDS